VAYFMAADNVKWRRPVVPGDVLVIEVELTKARGKIGRPSPSARWTAKSSARPKSPSCSATHDSSLRHSSIRKRRLVRLRDRPFCVIGEHVTLGDNCRLHSTP